jgi:hypothetical protein
MGTGPSVERIVRATNSSEQTSPQVGQAALSGLSAVISRAAHSWKQQLQRAAKRWEAASI